MKQMCNPINDLLIGAYAGMNMADCEGAARLSGDQKELLCFCAARALSIVNSEPGSCVPTSGNRSQHLNGSKWHQNKAPSAKGGQMTETHGRKTKTQTQVEHVMRQLYGSKPKRRRERTKTRHQKKAGW